MSEFIKGVSQMCYATGVGSDRCRLLKKGDGCVKNAKLSVT